MQGWDDPSVLETVSWRFVSELVRRHPRTTRVFHTHPGDGQYDCLTITAPSGDGPAIQLNRNGTIQVDGSFGGRPTTPWPGATWEEYLQADPRTFLTRLEQAAGLPVPPHVPSATPTTLTYRVLAALAATATKTVHPIEIRSGVLDTSGYGGGPDDVLDRFPAIPDALKRSRPDDPHGQQGYRFWIVMRDQVPILALEQSEGIAWSAHPGQGMDLMTRYAGAKRNVLMVAFSMLSAADDG